jgi:peptidoglycan-associated lipoprotein
VFAKQNIKPMRDGVVVLLAITAFGSSGCHQPAAPVTPTAPAARPAVTESKPSIQYFDAEPTTVQNGQSSSLKWSVENATKIEIDHDIGPVQASDRRTISPQETTTYVLRASNAAGGEERSVTVSVSTPPPVSRAEQEQQALTIVNTKLRDVHFGYNEEAVRPEDEARLKQDAALLTDVFRLDSNTIVMIEGHCDERGSAEYNIALGDRRAVSVREALVKFGVPEDKLRTISYGKERPLCDTDTEDCRAQNRRVHFATPGPESNSISSTLDR